MNAKPLSAPPVFCLMGPTASGKTQYALELVQHLPLEIISVDSAMVYRGMDIGTAKPEKEILESIPHHLIDIADPGDAYSAGRFRDDALSAIQMILRKGKLPLLVGGTMMYFNILHRGIASLPCADSAIRIKLQAKTEVEGLSSLYAELERIDPEAAKRINRNDSQRIHRALEVYYLSGKTITSLQKENTHPLDHYLIHYIGLLPSDRALLHKRIEKRFDEMLKQGFLDEVKSLYDRNDLSEALPSIRSVNYRQAWAYFKGELSREEMREKAIIATRQLAKRQLTWLRAWPELAAFDPMELGILKKVIHHIETI